MYSTHNECKSVVAETSIKTLKNKLYKYTTSVSKNVYINKLDDKVNKYNNTYHRAIKMKLVDVKSKHIVTPIKKSTKNILNLRLVTLLEYLHKIKLQIGLKKCL